MPAHGAHGPRPDAGLPSIPSVRRAHGGVRLPIGPGHRRVEAPGCPPGPAGWGMGRCTRARARGAVRSPQGLARRIDIPPPYRVVSPSHARTVRASPRSPPASASPPGRPAPRAPGSRRPAGAPPSPASPSPGRRPGHRGRPVHAPGAPGGARAAGTRTRSMRAGGPWGVGPSAGLFRHRTLSPFGHCLDPRQHQHPPRASRRPAPRGSRRPAGAPPSPASPPRAGAPAIEGSRPPPPARLVVLGHSIGQSDGCRPARFMS